jgi:glucose-1-phosphate thymidylyltransferase
MFVETLERRQGVKICCPEEVAFRMGFIDREQLTKIAQSMGKSSYGRYLHSVMDE